MLPHPILASEDDEDFIVRAILGLPDLLDRFFDCMDALYIEAKGTEYDQRARMLYMVIQRHLEILRGVPTTSFHPFNSDPRRREATEDLPKLIDRLSRLFLEDVITIGPQALWWRKPCLKLARDCADCIGQTRIQFPLRLRIQRQLVSFNSPLLITSVIIFCLSVIFAGTVAVVLPSVQPPLAVSVPIGCVSTVLLVLCSVVMVVHYVIATRSLNLLYQWQVDATKLFGLTPNLAVDDCFHPGRAGVMVPGGFGSGDGGTQSTTLRGHSQRDNATGNTGSNTLGMSVRVEKGRHTKKGYYTIPYGGDVGFIDGRQLDAQIVMIAFDSNFHITRWNNAAEVMTGFLEAGCIGKPLSELVQVQPPGDIHEFINRQRKNTPFRIKIRALAVSPMPLYTVVTPIVNMDDFHMGRMLICANVKDDLRDHRSYIHNYQISEVTDALSQLGGRNILSAHDRLIVGAVQKFITNCYAAKVEEQAREMITDWEWTNVEQLLGRAFGASVSSHDVHVDAIFPPTLCLNQGVPKVMKKVLGLCGGKSKVSLHMLNLMGNIFSLSVSFVQGSKCQPWTVEDLETVLRPLLDTTGGNIYYLDSRVVLHFPCQVSAVLDDSENATPTTSTIGHTQQLITQARAIVNCTVNVVTAINNMVDQHNLSLILLRTMFVSLASVQEPGDLEQRLSARPCEVDVLICDSDWLSSSRDLLFGDHGAIIIPIVDTEAPLSPEFRYAIRMPIVSRDVQQIMLEVGKQVSVKKDAITARQERERILTLRQDSPWTQGRLLGRGSYGAVYEATSDLTGGKMAVKTFYFGVNNEGAITQLLNEVKIMCSLNHVNIVHYFHCERTGDNVYLFMELCQASLMDIIVQSKRKPEQLTAVTILRQVLNAIVYLHGRGIAHRDIKPQNILLKGDVIKITDFGTARQGDATKEVKGTFRYMAPEVYRGQPHSLPCDIWSIGCLACELFGCPTKFMVQPSLLGEMTSADPYLQHIPSNPFLHDFLNKCFRMEPERRPTSHDLLAHTLVSRPSLSEDLPSVFEKPPKENYTQELCAFSIDSR